MLSLQCSCGGGSFRSGVQPPTGTREDDDSCYPSNALAGVDRSGRGFNLRPAQGRTMTYVVPPMFLRGWIVPVGGSTPDRHKGGR